MANSSLARRFRKFGMSAVGVALWVAPLRLAQGAELFSAKGSIAIGAEDLTGYYARSLKYWNREDRTVELSRSSFSFAFASGGTRLGVHYFILEHLSLGGSLGFENVSASNTYQDNPGTWTTEIPSENHILVAPRVGYALMFTPEVGIWFRGGVGYERIKRRAGEEGAAYFRDSLLMISGDVLFTWTPVSHLGVLIGPIGERSIVGRHFGHNPNGTDWSNDSRLYRLGITTGIVGYF